MIDVTAVFDIGRTNKKFFLFDKDFKQVHSSFAQLPEIEDEDGYPTEDLEALQRWIRLTFDAILEDDRYNIKGLNFSSYGASFVHLDKYGKVVAPLYNYTKDIEESLLEEFYATYGSVDTIAAETASPQCGMLNSGMQLYWLKKKRPDTFMKIHHSLHLPQYLSYLFTGIPLCEYTSLGCHTNLWDFEKEDYHEWVYRENLDVLMGSLVPTSASINTLYKDKRLKVGVGIHDSSAALLPYILSKKKPFLLLSTGTWSIALNPFNSEKLSQSDIHDNCLNYLRIDGNKVKASRFFMGNEYRNQVKMLSAYYNKDYGYHREVRFDKKVFLKLIKNPSIYFKFEGISLKRKKVERTQLEPFETFEEAFHQLMIELMELQKRVIENAMGNTMVKTIYIDGGFTDNDVFMKLMAHHFSNYKVLSTQTPLGSALGAAMVISKQKIDKSFLKENYRMKKLVPLLLEQQV